MKQVARVISTYTADVSGVCSALYELGGMVVMHDPSGCNSTYNTHDEPRWYHMDSLIFISGLAEIDAIMGNDDKLIDDVVEAVEQLHPRFVALARTPIPMMNGTDFDAICRVITTRTGIPAFYFPTNGTHSYVYGAGLALEKIAEYYVRCENLKSGEQALEKGEILKSEEPMAESCEILKLEEVAAENCEILKLEEAVTENGEIIKLEEPVAENCEISKSNEQRTANHRAKINLLGVTPLDFSVNETLSSVKQWIKKQGWETGCCFAMGSSLDEIAASGDADLNLVLSTVGLRAAKMLERTCGIPYVVGFPAGQFANRLAEDIRQTLADGSSRVSCIKRGDVKNRGDEKNTDGTVCNSHVRKLCFSKSSETDASSVIIGEAVTAGSLAAAMELQTGKTVRLICPLETESELLAPGDLQEGEEDELTRILAKAGEITADPLYRPICPAEAIFHELPHEAFSGRIYRKQMPDLTTYVKQEMEAKNGYSDRKKYAEA